MGFTNRGGNPASFVLDGSGAGSYTLNFGGPGSAFVVVAAIAENGSFTSMALDVNGHALTLVVHTATGGNDAGIFAGVVTLGSDPNTVSISDSGNGFGECNTECWTATGISSATPTHSGSAVTNASPISIAVTAGDLVFGITAPSTNWNSSSPAPSDQYTGNAGAYGTIAVAADWTIASTGTLAANIAGVQNFAIASYTPASGGGGTPWVPNDMGVFIPRRRVMVPYR